MLTANEVEAKLDILNADLTRKSKDTQTNYAYLARKFLTESGDFSRSGMMKWVNNCTLSDNSRRTAHYALQRLCKALEAKFPLDKDDLTPIPDEETLLTPTMTSDEIRQIIKYWRQFPGQYNTSLAFMSTIFGLRRNEMSDNQALKVISDGIIVKVSKRKTLVLREHKIPSVYMPFVRGYVEMNERGTEYHFTSLIRRSGIQPQYFANCHSIRRGLVTAFSDAGIPTPLFKKFMHWSPNRDDMASVYTHHPFELINGIMLGTEPDPLGHTVKHPFLEEWIK